jgi:catechol 2,3-dioxygenase-like lactoylglutathione lyase family enzyme
MSDERPTLDQLNIVVGDMDASTAFYRHLGFDIADQQPDWDRHHRTVQTGDGLDFDLDSNTFAQRWCRQWPAGRAGVVIGFRIATRAGVDAMYAKLTGAGYRGLQSPYDAFWGARYAIVADPDGNGVGLMSPSDPEFRTPPPDPGRLE